jgi:hypothetical protein
MAQNRLAVLIDADNVKATVADRLMQEVAALGTVCTVRIFGDWNSDRLKPWKAPVQRHGMVAVQQFSHARGKNSTDIALVIDAMDLLHEGRMEAFALVSSDSDFTRLAQRLRSSGYTVYGIGEGKSPAVLQAAYSRFMVMDAWTVCASPIAGPGATANAAPAKAAAPKARAVAKPAAALRPTPKPTPSHTPKPGAKAAAKSPARTALASINESTLASILAAFEHCKAQNGEASENAMQERLRQTLADFKPERPLGYTSMSALLSATRLFDLATVKGAPNRKRDHRVTLRAK